VSKNKLIDSFVAKFKENVKSGLEAVSFFLTCVVCIAVEACHTSLTEECLFYCNYSRMRGMKMIKKDLPFMSILPE